MAGRVQVELRVHSQQLWWPNLWNFWNMQSSSFSENRNVGEVMPLLGKCIRNDIWELWSYHILLTLFKKSFFFSEVNAVSIFSISSPVTQRFVNFGISVDSEFYRAKEKLMQQVEKFIESKFIESKENAFIFPLISNWVFQVK